MDANTMDPCQALNLWAINLSFTDIKSNASLVALYCSCTESINRCLGICSNPDLAGVGVRVAFYAQSVMNALLVFFSPRDSIPRSALIVISAFAWAATCLLIAVIIPAMVQKFGVAGPQITLHHATLIFKQFCHSFLFELSCCRSETAHLEASASRCFAWDHAATSPRLHYLTISSERPPNSYTSSATAYIVDAGWDTSSVRANQGDHEDADVSNSGIAEVAFDLNQNTEKIIKGRQNRQRIILSLALLLQVTLQWGWGITLFVSSSYKQTECSGTTQLWLFFHRYDTAVLQRAVGDRVHINALWPIWIMFCLSLTMFWTLMLACSGPSQAHDVHVLSRNSSRSSLHHRHYHLCTFSRWRMLCHGALAFVHWSANLPKHIVFLITHPRRAILGNHQVLILVNYVAAVFLWLMFVVVSELQIQINDIFDGENDWNGFGQVAALLLALAPLWNLIETFSRQIKKKRRYGSSKKRCCNINHGVECSTHAGGADTMEGSMDFSIRRPGFTERTTEVREQPGFQRANHNHQHSRSESSTALLLADWTPHTDSTWSNTMIGQWDEVDL